MKIDMGAVEIISELNKAGFDGFVVGGCVRDSLLGKEPKDWDICTNALPEQVIEVFKEYKILPTGIKHGTVTIMVCDEGFEVTTYRIDGEYSDGRHPDEVKFTGELIEDLSRRDFNINAMAYSEKDGVVDYFGGKKDLENRLIKCVGSPYARFNEDSLRILRALRFASVMDFRIEEETAKAIYIFKDNLKNVSIERVNVEISKMLTGKGVSIILHEFKDVIFEIIPELKEIYGFKQNNPYHKHDVWCHTVEVVKEVEDDKILRISALLHDIGKPSSYTEIEGGGHFYGHPDKSVEISEIILKRLRYSNEEIEEALTLIKYHDVQFINTKKFIKRMLNKMGEEKFRKLLKLREADIRGQQGVVRDRNDINIIYGIENTLNGMKIEDECFKLSHLAINGNDLINMGYKPSKELGETLNNLLEMVLDEEVENIKEELLKHC